MSHSSNLDLTRRDPNRTAEEKLNVTSQPPTIKRPASPIAQPTAHRIADPFAGLDVEPEGFQPERLNLNLLLKGPSGTGKTDFALRTTPGPILNVYSENNRATLLKIRKLRADITTLNVTSWADFERVVLPAVENRLYEARSIVVDTLDMLLDDMWLKLQGSNDKLRIQDFGTGKDSIKAALKILTGACVQRGGHPGYNIIVTSHTQENTDEDGRVVSSTIRVMGSSKDVIEDYFDYVLITAKKIKIEQVNNKPTKVPVCYATPFAPSPAHTTKAPLDWPEVISNYEELEKLL